MFTRGCFSPSEDSTPLSTGVPTFATQHDALAWCKQTSSETPSKLKHSITTFVGSKDINTYLLPRLSHHPRSDPTHPLLLPPTNRFAGVPEIRYQIESRLNLPQHKRKLSTMATANTMRYCFHHMRCGILVQIRDSKIVTLAPFVNDEYKNTWGNLLKTDPEPLERYYLEKKAHYRPENILTDVNSWWVNGNIICNEHDYTGRPGGEKITQWWGDHMLLPFKHMLETVCKERQVGDVDFFFNKRDYPQLRTDPTLEPYDFMFDSKEARIPANRTFPVMAPFVSFFCSPEFADLPIPTTEDWQSAVGLVFPDSTIPPIKDPSDLYTTENFKKFYVEWDKKVNTAFFRGTATGGGVTPETNQRLKLASLSVAWKQTPLDPPLLDAGVTGFNVRDKKLFGRPMTFLKTDELLHLKAAYTPMYQQGMYKYIVYVEGHCAANRYGFLMRLGSVIIKIESTTTASELWFFPLLKSQDCSRDFSADDDTAADHVLVKSDLSDLREKLEWCKRNDGSCKKIARNAATLNEKFISREAILDYWEVLLQEISKNTINVPTWWRPSMLDLTGVDPKRLPKIDLFGPTDCAGGDKKNCKRCLEMLQSFAPPLLLSSLSGGGAPSAKLQNYVPPPLLLRSSLSGSGHSLQKM